MHISLDMVRDNLPAIIEARGRDFQYKCHEGSDDTCRYEWKGEPDCIIGCFLVDLGFPIDAFADMEGMGIDHPVAVTFLAEHDFYVDDDALNAMTRIQQGQDNELTWGDAYDMVFDSTN